MYFDEDFLSFFVDLSANNNRDWFQANKKRYEGSVKKPFQAFVGDVIQKIKDKHDPKLDLEVKNALFRINRDIRFSKDKTPYNMHVSAIVSRGGRKDMTTPGIFFRFNPEAASIGGGLYMPSKEDLYAVREAIVQDPKGFEKILGDKTFKKYYPKGIMGDKNKVIPKEFKEAAEKQPLILNKQFYMMSEHKPDIVLKKNLADFVVDHYAAAEPWNQFVRKTLNIK